MGEQQRDRAPRVVKFRHVNKDLLAEIHHKDQAKVGTCAKCGLVPELVYSLECRHFLCPECAASTGIYTCAIHQKTTKIPVPLRGPLIPHEDLKKAAVICPGCCHPIMFETIKAHIGKMHADFWKEENQRAGTPNQGNDGTSTKNRGPPVKSGFSGFGAEDQRKVVDSRKTYNLRGAPRSSETSYGSHLRNQQHVSEEPPRQNGIQKGATIPGAYHLSNQHQAVPRDFSGQRTIKPDDSTNQSNYAGDEYSKSPGMSLVTPMDIKARSRAPPLAGYGSDADAAGWKGYPQAHKVDDLQRDSLVQQAPRPDESTAISEPAEEEDMDVTESSPPSPTTVPIPDSEQQMADISNISACRYCSKTFHVEKIQEHQDECPVLLTRAWKLFSCHILKHYEAHVKGEAQGSKQGTTSLEGDIKDTIMFLPEFKTLLKQLMDECYEKHLSEHGQGGHDVFATIEEHVCTCRTFRLRCADFWSQVTPGYNEAKENAECSTNVHAVECFQGNGESSFPHPNKNADVEASQKPESPQATTECPYCLTQWDVSKIEEHMKKCETLFTWFNGFFKQEIVPNYAARLGDRIRKATTSSKTATYNAGDALTSPSVYQKWFTLVMAALHKEHVNNPCRKIPEDYSSFKERIHNDQPFISKCYEFLGQVMLECNEEHSNGACLQKKDGHRGFQPEATPTWEPEKTTAAMSFQEKYSLKDVKGLADGILIPFKEKLNPELACCICKALTATGLKDGKGHTYCAYCTRVHTDALGLFTCSLCGWQAAPSEMSSNGEEWGILEKLTAACPNDNPKCTYQGTFKDVLVHYKSCALKTKVECPLCKSLHDRKTLAFHMAENCPKRVVECKFCNSDIEAWEKEIHEGSCRHRPGTCKYCLQEFSTIIELEEEHQPQCPKMPVKCSFYQLGCSFSAARSDVVVHEATTKHTDMLMEHVCLLKAENESLKRTIEYQEKKFQSIINNIKDSLSKIENRTNVAFERRQPRFLRYDPFGINPYRRTLEGEGASAGTLQKKIEERLAVVEEKLRSYQLPFEQLLRSISDLK